VQRGCDEISASGHGDGDSVSGMTVVKVDKNARAAIAEGAHDRTAAALICMCKGGGVGIPRALREFDPLGLTRRRTP
jgi:hypothetical protein